MGVFRKVLRFVVVALSFNSSSPLKKKALSLLVALPIVAWVLLVLPERASESLAAQGQSAAAEMPLEEIKLVSTWYDAGAFEASLIFNNKGPDVVEVDITLWNPSGRSFQAETEQVGPNSVSSLNLLDFVNRAGNAWRQGRVELVYRGKMLEIGSQLLLRDRSSGLIFSEQLIDPSLEFSSNRLEGLWWLPADGSELTLVVANRTDQPLAVNWTGRGRGGRRRPYLKSCRWLPMKLDGLLSIRST